jgi:hypothetical protein
MADTVRKDPDAMIQQGLTRMLTDQRRLDRRRILAGVVAYHREAMSRIPDFRTYPEAKPWVDYVLTYQRELQRLAELNEQQMALLISLNAYMTFRGYREAGAVLAKAHATEKCRVAFVPRTDQGPIHIKNVDDPITWWKPQPRLPRRASGWTQPPLSADGVGSGLHMDNEPSELFPLPITRMLPYCADDTPGAVAFLKRYAPFWSGANLLLFDRQCRSAAIEKCSRNFFECFSPNAHGHSHISGMTCRDPNSPQGRYQQAQRDRYRRLFGLPDDGPDDRFWAACRGMEKMLADALERLGPKPKAEDVMRLFTTTYPIGLNKAGLKLHPRQGLIGYTLITHAVLLRQRRVYRWQRSRDGRSWPTKPEICQYT